MSRSGGRGWWITALVLVALGVTVWNFQRLSTEAPSEPEAIRDAASLPPDAGMPSVGIPGEAEPTPVEEGPALEGTDDLVRKLAAALSSHPKLAAWLAGEGLIRRFVVIVDNVASGANPKKQVPFLEPKKDFSAIERGGRSFVDPTSYHRYDLIGEVVSSLDAKGCADLYRELKPYIDEAYRELGYPDRKFDDTFAQAIGNLLDVPRIEGEIPLDPRVTTHQYADNRLEELSPAKKQLLRMGPDNIGKIQGKLREIAAALELPVPAA